MTTFDQREKGYESKFAHDQELDFKIRAHANKLLGQWVAEKIGLKGDEAEDYTNSVVSDTVDKKHQDDVLARVIEDLRNNGVEISEQEVHTKMDHLFEVSRKDFM